MHVIITLKRKRGRPVRGLTANLPSVDWKANCEHLGYYVNAHPNLKWQEKDIHYAYASNHGAREYIYSMLRPLLEPLMPAFLGPLPLSYAPPSQNDDHIVFHKQHADAPAACILPKTRVQCRGSGETINSDSSGKWIRP